MNRTLRIFFSLIVVEAMEKVKVYKYFVSLYTHRKILPITFQLVLF